MTAPLLPSQGSQNNLDTYSDYYDKPSWWFKFRYDTQVKRKTCLHLIHLAHKSLTAQRVLELGFGSGATLFSFDPTSEIYGLEISSSAVQNAQAQAQKKHYRRAEFQLNDGSIPYPQGFFDIVIASHVLEHVPDDRATLLEMARVLKPTGVAVILVPINEHYEDPNHVRHYTPPSFEHAAGECGLKVLVRMQNELLFYMVEKFYFEEYAQKWGWFGKLIAAAFNFPTSVLPFGVYQFCDACLRGLGLKPRQAGFILALK